LDVILEPGKGAVMKKIRSKKNNYWQPLVNLADAILVCSHFGEAIRPAQVSSCKNAGCNSLPEAYDYLAAHITCLNVLASRSGEKHLDAQVPFLQATFLQNALGYIREPFQSLQSR
jgi:hypothetical protein